MSKGKRIILIVSIILMVVIVVPTLTITIAWRNEISTISSIKLLSDSVDDTYTGPVYEMTVKGDYYFDDFI